MPNLHYMFSVDVMEPKDVSTLTAVINFMSNLCQGFSMNFMTNLRPIFSVDVMEPKDISALTAD